MNKQSRYECYKESGVEWIGETPEHWNIQPGKVLFSERIDRKGENKFELLAVTQSQGVIKQKELEVKKDISSIDKSNYKIVCESDIVYNKMRMWQGAVGFSKYNGIVSPAYVILKPRDNVIPKYYHYLFKSPLMIYAFGLFSYGICDDQNSLRYNSFKQIIMQNPPLKEQLAIANFLDHKTSEIDALIADKEKLIELLKEQRQAIITEAVTKGLNPDVKMKDSGVEWIGEIPEHWKITRVRYLGEALIGLIYSPTDITDDGMLVLRASNIKNSKIVYDDNVYVDTPIPDELITKHGDILICSRSGSRDLIGKNVCIDKNSEGNTFGAFMTVIRSKHWRLLYYVFNSTLFKFQSSSFLTSTINQLTLSNLKTFVVPLPPEQEQQEISNVLVEKTDVIDKCIYGIDIQVNKLKEYRQSLIYEAVTGKIDVRDWADKPFERSVAVANA